MLPCCLERHRQDLLAAPELVEAAIELASASRVDLGLRARAFALLLAAVEDGAEEMVEGRDTRRMLAAVAREWLPQIAEAECLYEFLSPKSPL